MKIREAQKTIHDAEHLIESMMQMIIEQRYIIERYRLMHGNDIFGLPIKELPDDIDYGTTGGVGDLKLLRTQAISPKFNRIKERYEQII